MRLLLGVSVSAAFLWCSAPLPASADPAPIDMNSTEQGHYGNGTHNRNIYSLKSPTNNHGYQHTSTSTAGGVTNIQNAMCKNVKVCNIIQQVTPTAETTAPNTAETVLPETVQEPAAHVAEPAAPPNVPPVWCTFVLPGAVSISALSPFTVSAARKAPDAGDRVVRLPAGAGRHPRPRGHRVMSR